MDYARAKKPELVDLCKKRGLSTIGKINDLIQRLTEYDQNKSVVSMQFDNLDEKDPSGHEIQIESKTPPAQEKKNTEHKIESKLSLPENYFYIQIKAANLFNYFSHGCFYPLALEESKIYKEENRPKDILSRFQYYIILSKNAINSIESTDVLVEANLNGIEIEQIEGLDFFYTGKPIPISRVVSIYFATQELKKSFLSSALVFPDAFIPTSICSTIDSRVLTSSINLESIKLPFNPSFSDWKRKLDSYDRILGMFAFMKNAGIFSLPYENQLYEFTNGFLSTLYKLNNIDELSHFKANPLLLYIINSNEIELSTVYRIIFKQIISQIDKNQTFDFNSAFTILDSAIDSKVANEQDKKDLNIIMSLFKDLKSLKISHKTLLSNELIRKKHPALLALALLVKFPNKSMQHTDKQAVRNLFIDNDLQFKQNEMEFLLAILGYYYGYKSLTKSDTNLKFTNRNVENFALSFQSIKFSTNTYWDRFIIESIFQYCTNSVAVSDHFSFLKYKSEKLAYIMPSLNNSTEEFKNETYQIFDKYIYRYSRKDNSLKILELVNTNYQTSIDRNSYIIHLLVKNLAWNKTMLLDLIQKNISSFTLEEINKVVDLDSKKNLK